MYNLAKRFQNTIIKNERMKILGVKKNKKWNWINRKKMNNKINFALDKLKDNNINKGDRVIYKGDNSVNWVAWNLAVNSLGAIWVPIYNNQKDEYLDKSRIEIEKKKATELFGKHLEVLPFDGKHVVNVDYINDLI